MRQVAIFISVIVVASISAAGRSPAPQQKAGAGIAAPASAEVSQYINAAAAGSAGTIVLVVDGKEIDQTMTRGVATGIGGAGDVFTAEFVSAGLYKKASKGDATFLKQLAALGPVSKILLVERHFGASVDTSSISAKGGDTSAVRGDPTFTRGNTTLEVRAFDVGSAWRSTTYTINGYGMGNSEPDARQASDDAAVRTLIYRIMTGKNPGRSR